MLKKKKSSIYQLMYFKKFIICFIMFFIYCGTNPKSKVLPLISSNISSTTNTPQFLSISPISWSKKKKIKPEFLIRYYVTNKEEQFLGYNLYISEVNSSTDSNSIYKTNGIEPSFPHTPSETSTLKSSLKVKKIPYRKTDPTPSHFENCKMYSFTFKAILSNSSHSAISKSISRCSVLDAKYCEIGSSCNPTVCSNSSCSESQKLKCPVGTKCNPCLYEDEKKTGCICPEGKKELGCYL